MPSPPKSTPDGVISKALVEPVEMLINSVQVPPADRAKLQAAYRRMVAQQVLLSGKVAALEAQVQALMGAFHWD